MKSKKILLITLLLLTVFTISAVSAADNLTDEEILQDTSSEEIELSDEVNDEVVSSSHEDIIGEQDNGTFTALQNKINNAPSGSTITLENDYAYDEGFDTNGIGISKSLTINGNGHTIDGKEMSRIFNIVTQNIILKNIIFKNGCSNEGGAIYLKNGGLTAEGCLFYNCHSTYSGGAIYTDINGNTFKNCNFESCYADKGDGGAIKGSSSYYESCNFKNCWAGYYGGAIESYNTNSDMVKCTFTNCYANMYGGAVRFCKAVECKFINNKAGYPGGAICYGEAYNCYFSGNSEPTTYNTDIYSYTPNEYKSPTSSSTTKTTKTTPKIIAKKATFKVKTKTKKYKATLKTNKNKAMKKIKLYLKVKGKTYTAKTNNKGKATFNIKNLKKKGTYKATITFKGNKNFNKIAKTVKIIVK